jgi:DNA-binding MarR family transcriptional regulator
MNVLQKAQQFDRLLQDFRRSDVYKRPHDTSLNDADMMVLFCIGFCEEHQQVKLTDVSKKLRVTLPAVTYKVNMLVDNGYVQRKTSQEDKRATIVSLTGTGQSLVNKTKDTYYTHLFKIMEILGQEETDRFMQTLQKIAELNDEKV